MGPLATIRVLDLSRLLPGPFATLVLQDLGASVDKVEDAGAGDYLRHMPPARAGAGAGAAFHALNRGKRSAVIDLKSPAGLAAFRRLLARYDVLLEQFRPGVLERLGLGHDGLARDFPRLIVCALTGYGQTGPWAGRAGHDLNYLARAGLLAFQGPASEAPTVPGFQLADVSGGLWCVVAILAALRQREVTGRGQLIDVAMTDGLLGFSTLSVAAALNGGGAERGCDLLTGGIAPYRCYLSQDGWPVTLAALEPKFWTAFCQAAGLDVDLAALVPGPHQREHIGRLAALFRSRTRAEWAAFAQAHDCCVEVAVGPSELAEDAQLDARGAFFDVTTPSGPVRCFRTPVAAAAPPSTPAPAPGQHTRAMLAEAGLTDEEIAELLTSGAVREHRG